MSDLYSEKADILANEQAQDGSKASTSNSPDMRHVEDWLATRHAQAREVGDATSAAAICRLLEEWRSSPHNPLAATPPLAATGWRRWKKYLVMIFLWALILEGAQLALHYGVDRRAVGAGVLLAALASHALAFLVAIIGAVPLVGPLIVKILSIPIIWLLNSIGYLVSMVAIRRGYSKDVLTYRGLTMALITGIVLGYIFGKVI